MRPAYKEGGIKYTHRWQKIETCLQRGGSGIHTGGRVEQGADWRCGPSPGGLNVFFCESLMGLTRGQCKNITKMPISCILNDGPYICVQSCLRCLFERAPGLLVQSACTVDRGHSGDGIRDGNPSDIRSQK